MDKSVLIIEDEKSIADIVMFNLKREGFNTEHCDNGTDGLKLALEHTPDVVLLDVMLPGMDGFEVLKKIREKKNNLPVIMLTAREEENDKVLGLDLGADDYITKPFSMRELIARVKANTRRSSGSNPANDNSDNDEKKFEYDNLVIYPERHEVQKNGDTVELTAREYDLLAYMTSVPNKVVTREELMQNVWGYEYYGYLRAVDVAVRRLREKLEDNPAIPKWIITKRGIGYYFNTK